MEKWHVIGLLGLGLALLLGAVALRARYGVKYELKTVDFFLIVLPLLLGLIVTGNSKGLQAVLGAFGVKTDVSQIFADAASAEIKDQYVESGSPEVDEVVSILRTARKRGIQDIPNLIEQRTEALIFRLGHRGYYGPAIQQYFNKLYASSYLKYLVIENPDHSLFGIFNVLDLGVYFRRDEKEEQERAFKKFADWLNVDTPQGRKNLSRLPGFVSTEHAVERKMSKREVLKKMEKHRMENLPVINEDGKFVGTVERSKLTTSLILEVVDGLQTKAAYKDKS